MKEYFFQYDEIGRPLFFFEFIQDFNYNFYTTSFISDESLNYFERALTYAMDCTINKELACKNTFYKLMELDSRKFMNYTNSLQQDFISSRYLNNRKLNLDLLKSDLQIIKRLQNNMQIIDYENVNKLLSSMLNENQVRKFELLMNTNISAISRREFAHRIDMQLPVNFLDEHHYYVCFLGLYELLIYLNPINGFICRVKPVKSESE